jgi:hypothetical protein
MAPTQKSLKSHIKKGRGGPPRLGSLPVTFAPRGRQSRGTPNRDADLRQAPLPHRIVLTVRANRLA